MSGCPPPKSRLLFEQLAPFDFNDGRRQPKRDCSRRRCEHERGCHPECPLLESSRYAQLALSLVLHSDAPGRRSQGSDGEHHHRGPRRNQLARRAHRRAERQVRGVVLSKEQGSLPPSAGNTAAPSRFGGLISASFLCRLGFHVDVSRTGIRLAVLKAFKRPFPKIGAAGSTAGAAAFVPVHTLSACMP